MKRARGASYFKSVASGIFSFFPRFCFLIGDRFFLLSRVLYKGKPIGYGLNDFPLCRTSIGCSWRQRGQVGLRYDPTDPTEGARGHDCRHPSHRFLSPHHHPTHCGHLCLLPEV